MKMGRGRGSVEGRLRKRRKGGRKRGTEDWDRVRGKRGSGIRRERGGERGNWRIVSWNVAGLNNKDKEFWKSLKK